MEWVRAVLETKQRATECLTTDALFAFAVWRPRIEDNYPLGWHCEFRDENARQRFRKAPIFRQPMIKQKGSPFQESPSFPRPN